MPDQWPKTLWLCDSCDRTETHQFGCTTICPTYPVEVVSAVRRIADAELRLFERTKTGRIFTDDDFEALADEAEKDEFDGAGCCPEEDGWLRAQARGREAAKVDSEAVALLRSIVGPEPLNRVNTYTLTKARLFLQRLDATGE